MRDKSLGHYRGLWETLKVLPDRRAAAERASTTVARGRAEYGTVEAATGIAWPVVGAIHSLEASCDFSKGLHNGEPWWRKTTLVPKGKGPFASWEEAAIDALRGSPGLRSRDIAAILQGLEVYNGMGYARRGVESPYLWSFSNHGDGVGKFVADGKYDPNAVSQQCGAAVILFLLAERGVWVPGNGGNPYESAKESGGNGPVSAPNAVDGLWGQPSIEALQTALNAVARDSRALVFDPLVIDGKAGPKTRALFERVGDLLWPATEPGATVENTWEGAR